MKEIKKDGHDRDESGYKTFIVMYLSKVRTSM